jgi:hypothetical protein
MSITATSTRAELLHALRAHPGFANLVNCLRVDRAAWARSERANADGTAIWDDVDECPCEARERREAYDLVLELLGQTPEPPRRGKP